MKNIYHWCCKLTCYIGLALAGNAITNNGAIAQTTAPANDGYTPLNVGTIIPNGNTYYRDERQKTVFATDVPDAESRLPDHVTLTDLSIAPSSGSGGVEIKWRTTWEPNNLKLYEIQYSKDGITFQQAGVLPAQNYLNGKYYLYRHLAVNGRDRVFYRVRMVDANGRYEYSRTIPVQANNTTQNYIFPTIVNTGNVSMILNDDSYRTVQIVNMQGRILQTENLNGRTGRIDIQLNQSANGICIVRVFGTDPQKSIVQKIFINS